MRVDDSGQAAPGGQRQTRLTGTIKTPARIRNRTTLMHDFGDQAAGSPRRAAGELEAAALAVLQASSSALTPGEVLDRLGGGLAYTTVVTILSRLHAKGVLTRLRSGRAYSYAPVADEPGLAARRMRGVLDA